MYKPVEIFRSLFLYVLALLFLLVWFSSQALASECEKEYFDENYEEALQPCLDEEKYFYVGYIYGQKNDCKNMQYFYTKSDTSSGYGNLGINLLFGWSGCEKSPETGIQNLDKAVSMGGKGYARILGDHFHDLGKKKIAINYYITASEKNNFSSEWEEKQAALATTKLLTLLDFKEKLNLVIDAKLQESSHCKLTASLYGKSFEEVVEFISKNSTQREKFLGALCEGQKEYFLGLTYQRGLGNKEDFIEAYRLYLMAGAKGLLAVEYPKNDIRGQLNSEQIEYAKCLADYGIKPSYIQKLFCRWLN